MQRPAWPAGAGPTASLVRKSPLRKLKRRVAWDQQSSADARRRGPSGLLLTITLVALVIYRLVGVEALTRRKRGLLLFLLLDVIAVLLLGGVPVSLAHPRQLEAPDRLARVGRHLSRGVAHRQREVLADALLVPRRGHNVLGRPPARPQSDLAPAERAEHAPSHRLDEAAHPVLLRRALGTELLDHLLDA